MTTEHDLEGACEDSPEEGLMHSKRLKPSGAAQADWVGPGWPWAELCACGVVVYPLGALG